MIRKRACFQTGYYQSHHFFPWTVLGHYFVDDGLLWLRSHLWHSLWHWWFQSWCTKRLSNLILFMLIMNIKVTAIGANARIKACQHVLLVQMSQLPSCCLDAIKAIKQNTLESLVLCAACLMCSCYPRAHELKPPGFCHHAQHIAVTAGNFVRVMSANRFIPPA